MLENVKNAKFIGVLGALLTTVMCIRCFDWGELTAEECEVLARRDELVERLDCVSMQYFVLQGRVKRHFSSFCVDSCIETEISRDKLLDVCRGARITQIKNFILCGTVLKFTIVGLLVFLLIKHSAGIFRFFASASGVPSSFLLPAIIILIALPLVCCGFGKRRGVKEYEAEVKKLLSTCKSQEKKCRNLIDSVRQYNVLSEEVKREILVSESLANEVQEEILLGAFVNKRAEKFIEKVEEELARRHMFYCA